MRTVAALGELWLGLRDHGSAAGLTLTGWRRLPVGFSCPDPRTGADRRPSADAELGVRLGEVDVRALVFARVDRIPRARVGPVLARWQPRRCGGSQPMTTTAGSSMCSPPSRGLAGDGGQVRCTPARGAPSPSARGDHRQPLRTHRASPRHPIFGRPPKGPGGAVVGTIWVPRWVPEASPSSSPPGTMPLTLAFGWRRGDSNPRTS